MAALGVGSAEEQRLPEVPREEAAFVRTSQKLAIWSLPYFQPTSTVRLSTGALSVTPDSPLALCTVPQLHALASALCLGSLAKPGASLGLQQEYLGVRARCCLPNAPGTLISDTETSSSCSFQPNAAIILPSILPKDHLCNEKAGS